MVGESVPNATIESLAADAITGHENPRNAGSGYGRGFRRLPAETLNDWGGYSQLLWGIRPRIIAGLRGEIARGGAAAFASDLRGDQERVSPNFTWYPSEFSKLRLQYNYDRRAGLPDEHSLWLQFEFMLGAHAAHKF